MARKPWGSAAQRAALAKAQKVSAARRRGKSLPGTRRRYSSNPAKRGTGVAGFKRNATPYVRLNKRSQTGGFNAGTILPGTKKRIVLGGYVRVENVNRKGAIDHALSKAGGFVAPRGTKRAAVRGYLKNNVTVTNPAVRARVGKLGEARLSTSRSGGPTITLRRGSHKTPLKKSRAGIKAYDKRVRVLTKAKKSKPRRARRGRG